MTTGSREAKEAAQESTDSVEGDEESEEDEDFVDSEEEDIELGYKDLVGRITSVAKQAIGRKSGRRGKAQVKEPRNVRRARHKRQAASRRWRRSFGMGDGLTRKTWTELMRAKARLKCLKARNEVRRAKKWRSHMLKEGDHLVGTSGVNGRRRNKRIRLVEKQGTFVTNKTDLNFYELFL